MLPRSFMLLILLLTGCAPLSGEEREFSQVARTGDFNEDSPDGEDPGRKGDGPGEDGDEDEDSSTPSDSDGSDEDDSWDPSEPDVGDGTTAIFTLDCGLLEGPATKRYERDGARWNEVRSGPEDDKVAVRPELASCFSDGPKQLVWYSDGEVWFEAGGLSHTASPTETTNFWGGSVSPSEGSSKACSDALSGLELSWPVSIGLTLVELASPS